MALTAILCHVLGHKPAEHVIFRDERLGRAYRTQTHALICPRCNKTLKVGDSREV